MTSDIFFGSGTLWAKPSGTAQTPIKFGALQGVSLDFSWNTKECYGRNRLPILSTKGQATITGTVDFAALDGKLIGQLFFGNTPTAGRQTVIDAEQVTAPSCSNTVTVACASVFVKDLGVRQSSNLNPLERVTSGPGDLQYACNESTGVYSFSASQQSRTLLVSYLISDANRGVSVPITNDQQGIGPQFAMVLEQSFGGCQAVLVLNSCTSTRLTAGFKLGDFTVPQMSFTAAAAANGSIGDLNITYPATGGFYEDFEGGLSLYSAESGNQAVFVLTPTPWGQGLRVKTQSNPTFAQIGRSFCQLSASKAVLRVMKEIQQSNDGSIILWTSSGVNIITFNASREASFDPTVQRAQVGIQGDLIFLGTVGLVIGTWYDVEIILAAGAGNSYCTVRESISGAFVSKDYFPSDHTPPVLLDALHFFDDSGGSTTQAVFDDVAVR